MALENIITQLLEINYLPKYEKADMPYSEKHRVKVRVWQTLVVLLEFLDPNLYTYEFRKLRQVHTKKDLIVDFNKHLWKIVALNHLPTVRQYIEIVAIKFTMCYPSISLEDPLFIKTLLDPNTKPQVASSYLCIAGFVMCKRLDYVSNEV